MKYEIGKRYSHPSTPNDWFIILAEDNGTYWYKDSKNRYSTQYLLKNFYNEVDYDSENTSTIQEDIKNMNKRLGDLEASRGKLSKTESSQIHQMISETNRRLKVIEHNLELDEFRKECDITTFNYGDYIIWGVSHKSGLNISGDSRTTSLNKLLENHRQRVNLLQGVNNENIGK